MSVSHIHPETHAHPELSFVRKYIFSEDHKIIGIQFLFSTLIFLAIGGMLALFVRMQLAWPHGELPIFRDIFQDSNGGRMSLEYYNMLFSMHASVMIFFVIIPMLAGAFGNYLIPLQIGAGDIHHRQAGGHVREPRIGTAGFEDRIVDPSVDERALLADLGDRVGVDADIPSAVPDGEVRQGTERDAAGARARTPVAKAVRHQQRIAELLESGRQIGRRQAGE